MNGQQFTNARVHDWLTPDLDAVVRSMRTTRVQLNSAALWWFCSRLSPQERAEILGEYVKNHALKAVDEPDPPYPGGDPDPDDPRAKRKKHQDDE